MPSAWRVIPFKEIAIGSLFAAGTVVPLAHGLTRALLPGWCFFACLCSLNCICIAVWEQELDRAQQRISIATAFPLLSRAMLPVLLLICLTSPCLAGRFSYCIVTSAFLLAALHVYGRKRDCDTRTALADLVLLTPLALLFTR